MGHHHSHDHNHSGHCHGKGAPMRALLIAIALIAIFAVIEAFAGWWSNSLALLGDAGHMASDALSLVIAAFAAWIANKPPSDKHSYGLGRAEVVAAWISSLLMLIISIAIIVEAIERIREPVQVQSITVIIVGFAGLAINLLVAWVLARSERTLNIRAALLHVMGDVLGSMAAIIAGAVIYYTGWTPIDPILSIFIGILITISSVRLLRESLLVLMEGVPAHINMDQVSQTIEGIDGIKAIHDLHIWTLSSGVTVLSAHVNIRELSQWPALLVSIKAKMRSHYNIDHITFQPEPEIIDCGGCK